MAKVFLGVDGGATKTKGAIINAAGKLQNVAEAAASNPDVVGLQSAIENLTQTVKRLLKGIKNDQIFGCFALAGVDFENDRKEWISAINKNNFLKSIFTQPPLVVNDTQAALRAGTANKNAVVVISGTGSNCYGRNERGNEAQAGGVGHILNDEGSGYFIGLEILRSIKKALDGRGKPTVLTDLVFDKFKIKTLEELADLVYSKPWDKTDIAQIAYLIDEAAKEKDKQAIEILTQASQELGLMVKVVTEKLNLKNKKFTLVTAGSVLKIGKPLCSHFRQEVKKFAPKVEFAQPKIDAAYAAALIAHENF